MSLIPSAFADGAAAAASSGPMSSVMSFLPMVVIFGGWKETLVSCKKGSEVVTNGGMLGTITDLDEKFIKLRIADGVVVKFQRSAIAGKIDSNAVSAANK